MIVKMIKVQTKFLKKGISKGYSKNIEFEECVNCSIGKEEVTKKNVCSML